jgi:hypothetical protein
MDERRCEHEIWIYRPEYCCDRRLVCRGCGRSTRVHRIPVDLRRDDEAIIDRDGLVRKA